MDLRQTTRRAFFGQAGFGIGSMALGSLWAQDTRTLSHFAARARNVIYLFMYGAPSQLDLFDYKPALVKHNDQPIPEEIIRGQRFAFIKGVPKLLGSPYPFRRWGGSGAEISELLPHIGSIADEIAIVRSVHTDFFNHGPAQIYMNTGHQIVGRPSMGAWLSYGLGSPNCNLPAFVVLVSGKIDPGGGSACWGNGFLPTVHQGVRLRSQGDPVLCLSNPDGVDAAARRRSLDVLRTLNQKRLDAVGDPEIDARIAAYEMAYGMQSSMPELADLSAEPESIHRLYGTEPGKVSFANNCLLARRLIERGVRFVQLYHRGWDHHGSDASDDLGTGLPTLCRQTDRACAALVLDLKQRGLLDETLVIWGGEFGRTPMHEGRNLKLLGRDHHIRAFTMWFAGGGTRRGVTIGATDELGYSIVEDPVHVHDVHATVLHLMGLDHTRLTYKFQGRAFRLTDEAGRVVTKLLA
jgi:hypothetical protein